MHGTLRLATTTAHHALDHHPLMRRLTGSDLTRAQYAESLSAMYRPHVRLQRRVHESRHRLDSALTLHDRIELLEADLQALDCRVPSVARMPPNEPETHAAWWGRVYVLEGSRLGAAVMARHIRASLGYGVPHRFLGEAIIPGGREALLAGLDRELQDQDDLDQAAASAEAAFACYLGDLDALDDPRRSRNDRPAEATK